MDRAILWSIVALAIYITAVVSFLSTPLRHLEDRGYVTAELVVSNALKRFNRLETKNDGALVLAEFCERVSTEQTENGAWCRYRFSKMDANGDGRVSSTEMADFYLTMLRTSDQDNDGRVTQDEWLTATQVEHVVTFDH